MALRTGKLASHRKPRFILALIVAVTMAQSTSFRVSELTRYAFLIGLLGLLTWLLIGMTAGRPRLTLPRAETAALAAFVGLGFAPHLTSARPLAVEWVMVDSLTISAILLGVALADSWREADRSWIFLVLTAGLLASALVGFATSQSGIRTYAPTYLLLGLASGLLQTRSSFGQLLAIPLYSFVLGAALWSRTRNAIGAALVGPTLKSLVRLRTSTLLKASVAIVCCVGLYQLKPAQAALEALRLDSLAVGQVDRSTEGRFVDSAEALADLRSQSAIAPLLGTGHGGYYFPEQAGTLDGADELGRFHAIHFGVVRVYFRYGIWGTIAFAIFVTRLLLRSRRLLERNRDSLDRGFAIAAVLILISYITSNPLSQFSAPLVIGYVWRAGAVIGRCGPAPEPQAGQEGDVRLALRNPEIQHAQRAVQPAIS